MKRPVSTSLILLALGFFVAPASVHAETELSAQRLDMLDKWGCFTPAFKAAVHDLVDAKDGIVIAQKDEARLKAGLPDLQKQADDAEAKQAALQKELDGYQEIEQSDFAALQKIMSDPGAKPEDQRVLAQAYVWAYPLSPHQTEAQADLQQIEKKIADHAQAEKDAESAQAAARADLIARAQAKKLSLQQWRDFLRDMSQEDVLKYLGRPESVSDDYWTYSGDWTEDPVTHQKVGIQINFNAARVISVSEIPPAQ